MREGRQAQRGDDGDTLVTHVDFVNAPLVAVDRALDQTSNVLWGLQGGVLIEVGQVDEKYSRAPQFSDPAALTRSEAVDDRAGNVGA